MSPFIGALLLTIGLMVFAVFVVMWPDLMDWAEKKFNLPPWAYIGIYVAPLFTVGYAVFLYILTN